MDWMVGDFFDVFTAQFSGKSWYLNRKEFPAGYFAAEYLNDWKLLLKEIAALVETFDTEFTAFLCARNSLAVALAQQEMDKLWHKISMLPVYRELNPSGKARPLMHYLLEHEEETDTLLDENSPNYSLMHSWQHKLRDLYWEIPRIHDNLLSIYEQYFNKQPERSASGYAKLFANYQERIFNAQRYMAEAYYSCDYDDEMTEKERLRHKEDDEREFKVLSAFDNIPANITFRAINDPKHKGEAILVEEMDFTSLWDFLRLDLLRGLAAGHIPRLCANCNRYFLLECGYDIKYCDRIDSNDRRKRPCRVVGPMKAEALKKLRRKAGAPKIQVGVSNEYTKAYNRLKKRHSRGKMSYEEWIEQTNYLRDLRDKAARREIGITKFCKLCEKI